MIDSVQLKVDGMKCGGCETNVQNQLQAIDGVLSVTASSKDKQVNIEFDSEKTTLAVISKAIGDAGFRVVTE